MSLTNEDVQDIVRLLDDLRYDELHLRTRHFMLSLRRDPAGGWSQATRTLSTPNVVEGPPVDEPASRREQAAPDGTVPVRTPLVGTFYRAPKPGATPFVEVGAAVEEDTVVGLVETMKLFTPVYAGVRGRVAEIRIGNGEFAEQDAVLMLIEPEAE